MKYVKNPQPVQNEFRTELEHWFGKNGAAGIDDFEDFNQFMNPEKVLCPISAF